MAHSNLVQVKKNKTLKWLSNLPEDEQSVIFDLAVKQRFVSEEMMRSQQRQQKMLEENE